MVQIPQNQRSAGQLCYSQDDAIMTSRASWETNIGVIFEASVLEATGVGCWHINKSYKQIDIKHAHIISEKNYSSYI